MVFAAGSTRAITIVSARCPAGGISPLPPKIAPASDVLRARSRVSLPTTRKFCGLSCFAAASATPTRSMLLYCTTPHTTTPATSNAANAKHRAIQRRAICDRDCGRFEGLAGSRSPTGRDAGGRPDGFDAAPGLGAGRRPLEGWPADRCRSRFAGGGRRSDRVAVGRRASLWGRSGTEADRNPNVTRGRGSVPVPAAHLTAVHLRPTACPPEWPPSARGAVRGRARPRCCAGSDSSHPRWSRTG